EQRGEDGRRAKAQAKARTLEAAALGWDASPISTARMAAELWPHIKDLDWAMVGSERQMSSWPSRMWPMEKHYSHIGSSGGYGVGYNSPAAVGAALANPDLGRLSVNHQPAGGHMVRPGRLVDAAGHQIPHATV